MLTITCPVFPALPEKKKSCCLVHKVESYLLLHLCLFVFLSYFLYFINLKNTVKVTVQFGELK